MSHVVADHGAAIASERAASTTTTAAERPFVLGTPLGGWEPLARAVLEGASPPLVIDSPALADWLDVQLGREPSAWCGASPPANSAAGLDLPGGLDARACWALDALAERFADARFLVFVESPARALATWIGQGAQAQTAAAALTLWSTGAQRILRLAHTQPERVILVDCDEAAARPEALADLLHRELGAAVGGWSVPAGPDPLAHALAAALIATDRALQTRQVELLASCRPLDDTLAPDAKAIAPDRDAVVRELRELRARAAAAASASAAADGLQQRLDAAGLAADRLARERELLEARLHDAQTELEALLQHDQTVKAESALSRQRIENLERLVATAGEDHARQVAQLRATRSEDAAALSQLAAERDRLRRQVGALTTARERLARRIEQVLGERDAAVQQRDGLSQERDTLVQERETLARTCDALAQERESLAASREALAHRYTTLEAELSARTAALDEQVRRARAATAAGAALEVSLVETRTKLDATRARLRQQAERAQGLDHELAQAQQTLQRTQHELAGHLQLAPPAYAWLRAGAIVAGRAHDAGPHRHLDIELRDLKLPRRTHARVLLRLVEHHGSPGLALFATHGQPAVLSAWQPRSREGRRELMLLVPADDHGREVLLALGRADWLTVCGLALLLARELPVQARPAMGAWRDVAVRLVRQLHDMPPRLRYDAVTLSARDAGPSQDSLDVTFSGALFGDTPLDPLTLSWRPRGGDGGELLWRLPAGGIPALMHWPMEVPGRFAAAFALPVGGALPAERRRDGWAALSERERELVLGLLDALSAAARHAPEGTVSADRLVAAAEALRDDAQRQLRSLQVRRLARRALGRNA